jgi:poly [ADP-ribose] polymerase 2/3/4
MPLRKKATQPAAPVVPPLSDCVLALSGTFPGQSHSTLESYLSGLGATISKSVTKATTHLLTTADDFNGNSAKVSSAKSKAVHIVGLEWAQECEKKASRIPEADYLLSKPATNNPAQQNVSGPVFALPIRQSQAEDTKKDPNGKKEMAIGQIANSKDLVVPKDDMCTLSGYSVYIDETGVIYDASLNQTNASHNNNKFYKIQVCLYK